MLHRISGHPWKRATGALLLIPLMFVVLPGCADDQQPAATNADGKPVDNAKPVDSVRTADSVQTADGAAANGAEPSSSGSSRKDAVVEGGNDLPQNDAVSHAADESLLALESEERPRVNEPEVFSKGPKSEKIPELADLDRLIGTWRGTVTDKDGEERSITISRRWVMGGYYILTAFQYNGAQQTINALYLTTYDPEKDVFRRWYFDHGGYQNSLADAVQFSGDWVDDSTFQLDTLDPESGERVEFVHSFVEEDKEEWSLSYFEDGNQVDYYRGSNTRVSRDPHVAFRQQAGQDSSPVIASPSRPVDEIPELRTLNRLVGLWDGTMRDIQSGQEGGVRYVNNWAMNGRLLLTQFNLSNRAEEKDPDLQRDYYGMHLTTYDPAENVFRRWHFDTDAREAPVVRFWILSGGWSAEPPTLKLTGFAFDGRFQLTWTHSYPELDEESWVLGYSNPSMKYKPFQDCTLKRSKP